MHPQLRIQLQQLIEQQIFVALSAMRLKSIQEISSNLRCFFCLVYTQHNWHLSNQWDQILHLWESQAIVFGSHKISENCFDNCLDEML